MLTYKTKNFDLEVKDIDTKQGIISGYFSAFGMKDSDGDIIMPGAFTKSINENGPGSAKNRIKHLFNHNPSQPLGKILELKEDGYGLFYRSQIGNHALGIDFIKMAESGLITEHSIGFNIIREQKANEANEIHEVRLWEGSSLSGWGANENTPLVDMKSLVLIVDELTKRNDLNDKEKEQLIKLTIEQTKDDTTQAEISPEPDYTELLVYLKTINNNLKFR